MAFSDWSSITNFLYSSGVRSNLRRLSNKTVRHQGLLEMLIPCAVRCFQTAPRMFIFEGIIDVFSVMSITQKSVRQQNDGRRNFIEKSEFVYKCKFYKFLLLRFVKCYLEINLVLSYNRDWKQLNLFDMICEASVNPACWHHVTINTVLQDHLKRTFKDAFSPKSCLNETPIYYSSEATGPRTDPQTCPQQTDRNTEILLEQHLWMCFT